MSKHTPSPWEVNSCPSFIEIVTPNHWLVARTPSRDDSDKANANRIVGCVNALNGYNPEKLAGVLDILKQLGRHRGVWTEDLANDTIEDMALVARDALSTLKADQ